MQRRRVLTNSAFLGAAALAGCISGDDDITDSDGDGVIDGQDYAPQDTDVQEKADTQNVTPSVRKTETPTATETRTPTPSPTPTPTPRPTPTPEPNSLHVDGSEFPTEVSHFLEYGTDSADVWVHPDDPAISDTTGQELWAIGVDYFEGSLYAEGHTTINLGSSGTQATVNLDWESTPTDQPLHYGTLLRYASRPFDELAGSNTAYLHQTDAFEIQRDERTIDREKAGSVRDRDRTVYVPYVRK